jgi:hypothetical protein
MLMKDGKPAANMFAGGEIMAGNVLGKGYAAGIGMTIGSVFGRGFQYAHESVHPSRLVLGEIANPRKTRTA